MATNRENHRNKRKSDSSKETSQKMIDIESKDRLTSNSIGDLCTHPSLLRQYLESSIANTFSELIFRLTNEIYTEKKASELWHKIVEHREILEKGIGRDVGVLVAALDYLYNISGDILNPKIIDDLRLEEAAGMATRDSLTGLYLRGVFDFSLERIVLEHIKFNNPLSFVLLDIDDFKQINDNFGHQTGDEVLRRIGKVILKSIREFDFPARYGGEEIAIILPGTPIDQGLLMAERLRGDVQKSFAESGPPITMSIGVSFLRDPDIAKAGELVWQADNALYLAKRGGKNKVEKCT